MNKTYTIYFASSNKGKLGEVNKIFSAEKIAKFFTVKSAPKGFKVNENGKTFISNAFKKASMLSKKFGVYAFSDDSGIEIFALKRKPGIKSSRYFRNGLGMLDIIDKIKDKKNKKCCFTCAIVMTNPSGKIILKTVKSWFGIVTDKPRGKNGFGYDPIFLVPGLNKTSAEITSALKNKISHRAMAFKEFSSWLRANVERFN